LIRQQTALPLKLPERRQEPLFYRSEGKAAVFAAELRVHARRIAVDVSNRVQLSERLAQVEQKLTYTIDFEAVDHLLIDVPKSLAEISSLAFERDGKPLAVRAIAPGEEAPPPSGITRMRISLSEACLGGCTITARYALPLSALQAVKQTAETLPLIVPAEGEVTGNKLLLAAGAGIKASLQGQSWLPAEKELVRSGRQPPRSFKAAGRIDRLDLDIGKEETSGVNATVIDRAWIQTWLTSTVRQDRAVFQLLTNQSELNFKLPPGAVLTQMAIFLDGKRIEVQQSPGERFSIPLSNDGELRRYNLEIMYFFSDAALMPARLKFDFPQIGSGAWNRRLYWQLILPQNQHVIADPQGFVSEYHWGFQRYFWGRQPLLSQNELETWVGAAHRTAPPESLNVYLFSALGTIEGGEVRTAARVWIVLFSSGAALVLGLLLIYVPSLRHPATLLVLAFSCLGLGMIYPEPTIMLAQTSCIGLVLALITALLVRLFPPRRRRISELPAMKAELPSTKSPHLVPVPTASVSSTQNLPTLLE
jgi:hypothetical protein